MNQFKLIFALISMIIDYNRVSDEFILIAKLDSYTETMKNHLSLFSGSC